MAFDAAATQKKRRQRWPCVGYARAKSCGTIRQLKQERTKRAGDELRDLAGPGHRVTVQNPYEEATALGGKDRVVWLFNLELEDSREVACSIDAGRIVDVL